MARPRFEVRATMTNGKPGFYWRLVGANSEIVCHSETFQYPYQAKDAAKTARRLARLAKVER